METKKEIETKIRGILSVKRYRGGLTKEEQRTFEFLDSKYRNKQGCLVKGSFLVNSEGKWVKC